MIDLRRVRDASEAARESQRARGADPKDIDRLLAADEARRAAETRANAARAEQKALSRAVGAASPEERPALLAQAAELGAAVRAAQTEEAAAQSECSQLLAVIPNIIGAGVPAGGEADFVVLDTAGTPALGDPGQFRDHIELGTALGAIDDKRGAKVSGARFAYLIGIGALLELALVNAAITQAVAGGFIPVIPPVLVLPPAMEGTGFLGEHSAEVYRIADDDHYLVGTSEVPLAAMHSGEVLDSLPLRYAGFSTCFRREAGSYGKDTQGIIRVHQFDKVEMFVFTDLAQASDEHERLLAEERTFLDALELPYRVIEVAAGDLGSSAARKYDCEAWLPSQQRYLELTSTSNCTDFQARRLGIRHRPGGGATAHVATLNGTLCAVGRTIVALLENHQRPDGSVSVPALLRPWLGGREVLEPVTP
jgi:seryl-tRNA synthetase